METNPVPAVHLANVSRHFGEVKALDNIDLDILDGEFFSLLGPSGSGKTTTLRLIAGFDHPTTGKIELYSQDVTKLPPYERDVNTVFQDYALFPHMTVGQNVAYGLMIRRVPKPERAKRVQEILDLAAAWHGRSEAGPTIGRAAAAGGFGASVDQSSTCPAAR